MGSRSRGQVSYKLSIARCWPGCWALGESRGRVCAVLSKYQGGCIFARERRRFCAVCKLLKLVVSWARFKLERSHMHRLRLESLRLPILIFELILLHCVRPTAQCDNHCKSDPTKWSIKCQWGGCKKCSQCTKGKAFHCTTT